MQLFILFESASGYALFEKTEFEEVAGQLKEIQSSVTEFSRFSKLIKFKAFSPFEKAEKALENIMAIREGQVTEDLKEFLVSNLPSSKKKKTFLLGISDNSLGIELKEKTDFTLSANETIDEIVRGIRLHFNKFLKDLSEADLTKAQLGLAHSYSRSRVQHDINRQDKSIIQAIALVDQLDKNINTFCMRLKEWFSWHFPELARIASDNHTYVRLVNAIKSRDLLDESLLEKLEEITLDAEKAQQILDASNASMGQELTEIDQTNILSFTERVLRQIEYRESLGQYLATRMHAVAPNLSAIIGEIVGARLIAHAGSLINLSKYPASTIQILGAEKALFRALKEGGNTPKYGIIFHSSFIGRAGTKNKGRISRFLANKCAIASRIDQFSIQPNDKFGLAMKEQVEERLKFLSTGEKPRKNKDVMKEILDELKDEGLYFEAKEEPEDTEEKGASEEKKKKKKKNKRKAESAEVSDEEVEKPKKKKKKTEAA